MWHIIFLVLCGLVGLAIIAAVYGLSVLNGIAKGFDEMDQKRDTFNY